MKAFRQILPGDVLLGVVFVKVMIEPFNPWSVAALGVSALIAFWNHELSSRADERAKKDDQVLVELQERSKTLESLQSRFEKFALRLAELEDKLRDKNVGVAFGGKRG